MKKRFIIRILCMTLCLALLASGCGSKQEDNGKKVTNVTTTAPVEEKPEDNNEPAQTTLGPGEKAAPVTEAPKPTAEQQKNAAYFASVTENTDRMIKEAIEQYNAGDYTPLNEPVKYNVLWLGFTHVTYGELDFRMTDFDREYLQAVTLNYEKSLEEITNHNLDITVDLHFIDDVTQLTKTDNGDWLFLAKETVQYVIDKYSEDNEFDTVLTTIQTAGEENRQRNETKENYGVNYAILGLMISGMSSSMGYSTFDLQKPAEGTYPLADPKIPSLYATAIAVHEWMHQLEYMGSLLGIEYPDTHAYMGPESFPGYQQYINGENDYDFFEFYKLVLQGKLPYNDGTTVKYVGMYPKMWPLIKKNVFNLGKFVIKTADESGYLFARDEEEPMLFISYYECNWNIKYLSNGRFMFSPEKMADKLIDLGNAWDMEDNTIGLYVFTGYLDAQSWRIKENDDGTCSLQTPYESGRLFTVRDPKGAFLCSDGADGVQDWIIEPR